jgi:hypothetical protein
MQKETITFLFLKYTILVYKAENAEKIKRAFTRAKDSELYLRELFGTKNDAENLEVMRRYDPDGFDLVGIVVIEKVKSGPSI